VCARRAQLYALCAHTRTGCGPDQHRLELAGWGQAWPLCAARRARDWPGRQRGGRSQPGSPPHQWEGTVTHVAIEWRRPGDQGPWDPGSDVSRGSLELPGSGGRGRDRADGNADGNGAGRRRTTAVPDVLRSRKPTSWRTPAHVGGQHLGSFKTDGGAQGVPGGIVPLASRHFKWTCSGAPGAICGPGSVQLDGRGSLADHSGSEPISPTVRGLAPRLT